VFSGDSIFYAVQAADMDPSQRATFEPELNMARQLQQLLPDACVHTISQPGIMPYQHQRLLALWMAEHPVDVLIMGVWKPDLRLQKVGDRYVNVTPLLLDNGALPAWAPVPAPPNRFLFTTSALWFTLGLALAQPYDRAVGGQAYHDMVQAGVDADAAVVVVEFSRLDVPFAAWDDQRVPYGVRLQEALADDDVVYLQSHQLLADYTLEEVRLDTCCHFNAFGHQLWASLLKPVVEEHVKPWNEARSSADGTEPLR